MGWGGSNLELEVFGSRMYGLGSTRIGNILSRCEFSWFLQIEWTGSTHFDVVATPFLPFSPLDAGRAWLGRQRVDAGCGTMLATVAGRGGARCGGRTHAGLAWARGERTQDAGRDGAGARCGAGRARAWLGRGERMRGGAGHQDGRALTAEAEHWGRAVLCASGWATMRGGRWVEAS